MHYRVYLKNSYYLEFNKPVEKSVLYKIVSKTQTTGIYEHRYTGNPLEGIGSLVANSMAYLDTDSFIFKSLGETACIKLERIEYDKLRQWYADNHLEA